MKKYLIIFAIFGSLLFTSCSEDLAEVSETIYVQRGKVKMPVYVRGNVESKVIILVVHGGPGGNGFEYSYGTYADQLEADYGMAYWDQRGQGMSVGKYDDADLNIDEMVEDLKATILVLKHKYEGTEIFLMGHSWGGTLGSAFMIKEDYQNMLKGWIEADGAHDIPKLNKDATIMFRTISADQIALGNSVSSWQGLLDWSNGIDTSNISTDEGGDINKNGHKAEEYLQDDGLIEKPGDSDLNIMSNPINQLTSLLAGNSTSNKLHDEVESTSLTSQLNKITIPSLFLWGKYDFVVPPSLGEDAYNKVSSTSKKLVIFEKSGHSPMSNEPDKFVEEVKRFVEEHK